MSCVTENDCRLVTLTLAKTVWANGRGDFNSEIYAHIRSNHFPRNLGSSAQIHSSEKTDLECGHYAFEIWFFEIE